MAKRAKARAAQRQAPSAGVRRASAQQGMQPMSLRTRRIVFAVLAFIIILTMLAALAPGTLFAPS